MDYIETKKKLLAAQDLFLEQTTSFQKFAHAKTLLKGVHPKLDEFFAKAEAELAPIEKILGGDYVLLSIENLPERTEEDQRRKKAILFFWKTWRDLKGEVARVQAEMNSSQSTADASGKASAWGRVFRHAKGPFGILTVLAVAFVGASSYTSVEVVIHNKNCATMVPSTSMPLPIPGISFPQDPIVAGKTGIAHIPGVPVTIDGTKKGVLTAQILTFTMSFELGSVSSITLDGESLLGKVTKTNLYEPKSHDLVFTCK